MMKSPRALLVVPAVVGLALGLAACGGDEDAPAGGEVTSLALWDAFTQYDDNSAYGQLISTCETETGITIERTADQAYLDTMLQGASSGNLPNLAIVDNPSIATYANVGLLVDNSQTGLDTSEVRPNVLAAAEVDGKVYGSSLGSNTLALFYNTELFDKAGLEPPTTWDELRSAAKALSKDDVNGIGFSAINTEEGTFQFEPFFWGAGAALTDIGSPQAIQALQLWTDLVNDGSASKAVVSANQGDINDQFTAGKLGMMVNGTWQLAGLDEAGTPYTVVPVPAADGGPAPSPLGGEFIEVVASDEAHQKASGEFAQCMVDPENLKAWATGQSYILPTEEAADQQAADNPALKPWVEAIAVAKGRTADLGADYPKTSEQIWTAIQKSLSGAATPAEALKAGADALG
ncbi:sugar ABC transporter substrate-binding protein [Kineosporia babensis]|uniref:Extracellular solute-binding protein n=1 Tax=Kineosporia babensis TaxID=499548 RepID=A0A9X1NMA7_9ACTN|nr:extracellular solute-binding protein [Kineosporia babensis]MCD5316995.1 extracellular solute-binding protein [Kineosporia babensis]